MAPRGYVLTRDEARAFNRMRRDHRRQGPPKARRKPRRRSRASASSRPDPTLSQSKPWTTCEYDITNGDRLITFDRGKRRSQSTNLIDTDMVFSTDGDGNPRLYVCGQGYINREFGVIVCYDPDSGEKLWESDAGANTGPIFADKTNSYTINRMCMSSDGFLWVIGTDTSTSCVGRFNAETGVQTHKYAMSVAANLVQGVYPLSADGKVLVTTTTLIGGTKGAVILDDTATEVASQTDGIIRDIVINGDLIFTVNSTGSNRLKIYDSSLTIQDDRAAPGAEAYGPLAVKDDGTVVYVGTSGGATHMLRAYDATNLATENWNASVDSGVGTARRLIYANSALYSFAARVRKHSATDGSETWDSPTSGIAPSVIAVAPNACQVSSSRIIVLTGDTNEHVWCLSESTGEVLWFDDWSDNPYSALITDDDRLFVCGLRIGP